MGVEMPTAEAARRRVLALASKHAGALAFSRIGDPATGDYAPGVDKFTSGKGFHHVLEIDVTDAGLDVTMIRFPRATVVGKDEDDDSET